jgi:hypothetical protein
MYSAFNFSFPGPSEIPSFHAALDTFSKVADILLMAVSSDSPELTHGQSFRQLNTPLFGVPSSGFPSPQFSLLFLLSFVVLFSS